MTYKRDHKKIKNLLKAPNTYKNKNKKFIGGNCKQATERPHEFGKIPQFLYGSHWGHFE
jgi:hypothetical protein